MTPRGLKIRIGIPYAFGLMARLAPGRSAFRVLKTVEGLEHIPAILGFYAAIWVLLTSPATVAIISAIVIGRVLGILILWFGVFTIPGLVQIATLISYVSGYGILLVVSAVTAVVVFGWQGMIALGVGWILSMFLSGIVGWVMAWNRSRRIGQPITQSELNFFNAYRLHAASCGVSRDLVLSETEEHSNKWIDCLQDYADKYPEAVKRFEDSYFQALAQASRG